MPELLCTEDSHVWPWGSDYCQCGELYADDSDDNGVWNLITGEFIADGD